MLHLEVLLGPDGEVPLSYAQRQALGGGVRIPIRGTVNGTPFSTTGFRMGSFTGIAFRQSVQHAAGIGPGQPVVLDLERDTTERVVDVPASLAEALAADPVARAAYDGMSFTHQREYAEWVRDAKRQETRNRRVAKAVQLLRDGEPPR